MVVHFARTFPEQCDPGSDEPLRGAIRLGTDRSIHHGLTTEASVCTYITLMFLLGSSFDVDPLLPWAAAILADTDGEPEDLIAARLRDEAMAYLDAADGEDSEHVDAAMERLRATPLEDLFPALGDTGAVILEGLERLHPRKCAAAGQPAISAMIDRARAAAAAIGMETARGAGLVAVMMLLLGVGFANDPLIPWAGPLLAGIGAAPAAEREAQLHRALVARTADVLARRGA